MITRFGTLYAGHVELDNLGLQGTPVNERFLTNEHLATTFDISQAIAQLVDREGYDTLWLAEHHFQPEGYECKTHSPISSCWPYTWLRKRRT